MICFIGVDDCVERSLSAWWGSYLDLFAVVGFKRLVVGVSPALRMLNLCILNKAWATS